MMNNLPAIPGKAKAVWRIVTAAGSLLISQSAKLSEAYAKHQLRLAEVEAVKELMIGEAKIITEVRKKLIDKYLDAPHEDRIRLRQDIETAERDLRQLGIYHKAIEHIPESQNSTPLDAVEENLEPTTEFRAWLDTFNEYARKQNEPWRAELLARALALESEKVGVLGQRALWFIGTVDEREFHAFAAILDISSKIFGDYVIPDFDTYLLRDMPNYMGTGGNQFGQAIFIISTLGLFGDLLQSEKRFVTGESLVASYGERQIDAKFNQDFSVRGVLLTPLGETIARLYDPKVNSLGLEIFNKWIDGLRVSKIEVIAEK